MIFTLDIGITDKG